MNDNSAHPTGQYATGDFSTPHMSEVMPAPVTVILFAPRRRQARVAVGIFGDFVPDRGSGTIIIPANASNLPAEGEL
jgi:hypothetical protein